MCSESRDDGLDRELSVGCEGDQEGSRFLARAFERMDWPFPEEDRLGEEGTAPSATVRTGV